MHFFSYIFVYFIYIVTILRYFSRRSWLFFISKLSLVALETIKQKNLERAHFMFCSYFVSISTILRGFWRRPWSFWALYRCMYVGQLGIKLPMSLWLWKFVTIFFCSILWTYIVAFLGIFHGHLKFRDNKSLNLYDKSLERPQYMFFPHTKILSRIFIIGGTLIVIIYLLTYSYPLTLAGYLAVPNRLQKYLLIHLKGENTFSILN